MDQKRALLELVQLEAKILPSAGPIDPPPEEPPEIIDSDPLDVPDPGETPPDPGEEGIIDPTEEPINPNGTTFDATVSGIGEIVGGLTFMVQVSGIDLSGMQSPGLMIIGGVEQELDGTFQNENGSYDIVIMNGVDATTVAVGDSVLLNYEGGFDVPPPPEEDPLPPPEEDPLPPPDDPILDPIEDPYLPEDPYVEDPIEDPVP